MAIKEFLCKNIDKVADKFAPVAFKLKDASPKLMVIGGVGCLVGATVLACRATLKADKQLDEARDALATIKEAEARIQNGEKLEIQGRPMTLEDISTNRRAIKTSTIVRLAKDFGLPLAAAGLGIFLVTKGYKTEHSRYLGAVCSANAWAAAYNDLKTEIKENYYIPDGQLKTEQDEKKTYPSANVKEKVVEGYQLDAPWWGLYSIPYSYSSHYTKDPFKNKANIKGFYNHMCEKAKMRGYVTVWEYMDEAGISQRDQTLIREKIIGEGKATAGNVFNLGWVYNPEKDIDDLPLMAPECLKDFKDIIDADVRAFALGYISDVHIDFTPARIITAEMI